MNTKKAIGFAAFGLCAFAVSARAQNTPAPPVLSAAQEAEVEKAFKASVTLLENKKHAEALVELKKVLALLPDDEATLANAGQAAQYIRDYAFAAACYEKLRKQDPQNGRTLAKLVQVYEAGGKEKLRDTAREAVFALHKSGNDLTGYTKKPSYCRDQFTVDTKTVFAYERFEFVPWAKTGMFAPRYDFLVFSADATQECRVEVGWDSPEKNADGSFKPSGAFYFDAYYSKGPYSRKTMGLFPKELTYAESKKHLLDILAGKVKMSGGTRRPDPTP